LSWRRNEATIRCAPEPEKAVHALLGGEGQGWVGACGEGGGDTDPLNTAYKREWARKFEGRLKARVGAAVKGAGEIGEWWAKQKLKVKKATKEYGPVVISAAPAMSPFGVHVAEFGPMAPMYQGRRFFATEIRGLCVLSWYPN